MKVKTLKTVSAFGETINQDSIFEGDIKDFPKCIQKEIEMKAGTVIIMVDDEVKEKKEKDIQPEPLAESHVEEHLAKELELEEEKQKEEVKKEDEFPAAPPASSKKKAPKKTSRKKK
jgi:hypothetical protein